MNKQNLLRKSLAIIGPSQLIIDYAEKYATRILLIDTPGNLETFQYSSQQTSSIAEEYLSMPLTELHKQICAFRDAGPENEEFCGVLALTDMALLLQAQLNELLQIPDNSVATISKMVDKSLMRKYLNEHSTLVTKYALAEGNTQAKTLVRKFSPSYPCIAKPSIGRGSLGVHVIRNESELENLDYPLQLEEYITGQEYSAEGFVHEGKYHLFGITLKEKGIPEEADELAEFGHLHPAPLSSQTWEQVKTEIATMMEILKVKTGIHHTEFFITTDQQVRIVETHARNGGQHIVDIVRLATGVDMVECAIMQRLGLLEDQACREQKILNSQLGYAGVRYFSADSGQVKRIRGQVQAKYSRGVCGVEIYKQVGEEFTADVGSGQQIGCVIAQADSYRELDQVLDQALATVQIEID